MNRRAFLGALSTVPAGLVLGAARCGAANPLRTLRVLSYNIAHGNGADGRIDLERIAGIITAARPDIVALQEVDVRMERSGGVDQAAELGRLTGLQSFFGPNLNIQGGHYGNAVLTRLPVQGHTNHSLPFVEGTEPRGMLEVRLGREGANESDLIVLATHLDHQDEANRLSAAQWLHTFIASAPEKPMLLIGDLNMVPESAPMGIISEDWTRTNPAALPTFPASTPRRQIDYILYRPEARWQAVDTEVLNEPVASDHRPIFAELMLRG